MQSFNQSYTGKVNIVVNDTLSIEHIKAIWDLESCPCNDDFDITEALKYTDKCFEYQRLKNKYRDIQFRQPLSPKNCQQLTITRYLSNNYF